MITVTEDDFMAVACAAQDAQDRGDTRTAKVLDKLARKINADLSNKAVGQMTHGMRVTGKPSWKAMPSTLKDPL